MSEATMSFPTTPAPNRQAAATVGILNLVRWLSVGVFGVGAVISLLAGFIAMAQGEGALPLFGGMLIAVLCVIYGALAYAIIGWYVDSLALLKQIAENTRR